MIRIKKSETADTRTCDFSNVSIEELLNSSLSHLHDVRNGMNFFARALERAGAVHDFDKVSPEGLAAFHSDFVTGFKKTGWYDNHRQVNRHHIDQADGIREDVDLVDVIEHIVDCVTAGLARKGEVYDIKINSELLQRAVKNTQDKLVANIVVVDQ